VSEQAASNGGAILEASNVSKVFGGLVAVNDISFTVPRKGIVSLIGPNGAGKTTFFNCMTGLYKPTTGRVEFLGRNITGKRPDLVTQAGIARTFQNIKLFRTMTSIENVQVGMHGRLRSRMTGMVLHTPFNRREEKQAYERARDLLRFVGLRQHNELAMNLSYGDQRRLEIGIALGTHPRLLLLDEPMAGMSTPERRSLSALIRELRDRQGLTLVFTEHDMDVVFSLADVVHVLHQGRMLASGAPAAIRADPEVRRVYLGQDA
jgi:branched-chain amino acid transport system ATP-binding protein